VVEVTVGTPNTVPDTAIVLLFAPEDVKVIFPEFAPNGAFELKRTFSEFEIVPAAPTNKGLPFVPNVEKSFIETSKPAGGVTRIPSIIFVPDNVIAEDEAEAKPLHPCKPLTEVGLDEMNGIVIVKVAVLLQPLLSV
jgi:hypothetical protein